MLRLGASSLARAGAFRVEDPSPDGDDETAEEQAKDVRT